MCVFDAGEADFELKSLALMHAERAAVARAGRRAPPSMTSVSSVRKPKASRWRWASGAATTSPFAATFMTREEALNGLDPSSGTLDTVRAGGMGSRSAIGRPIAGVLPNWNRMPITAMNVQKFRRGPMTQSVRAAKLPFGWGNRRAGT